jgi:uncharacterized membrane protein YhhN
LVRRTIPFRVELLTVAIVASLALHLRAAYLGPAWQVFLFKPLTTLLLIALAYTERGGAIGFYRTAIVAGLGASLAGDVFLMLPADAFTPGLVCFLVAHLCYLRAFTADAGWRTSARLGPYAACYVLLMIVLVPHLGPLVLPVTIYGAVLVAMGWQAAERAARRRSVPALRGAVGGVLFIVSDSVLAVDRFVAPFEASTLVVMTTYIAAQWLIARSAEYEMNQPVLEVLRSVQEDDPVRPT